MPHNGKRSPSGESITDSPMLTAALSYAARGWFIFPAHKSGEKKSHKSAKHTSSGLPWGMSVDAQEIRADFKKFQGCNVSIVTGAVSGIFVVESDTKTGHGVDGASNLAELEKVNGELPPTLMAESPTLSRHRYFKHPGRKVWNSSNNIAPGVDCKGDGGMVIAVPSVMPARVATADKPAKPGGAYRWINEGHLIADAPQWLLDIVCKPTPKKNKDGTPKAEAEADDNDGNKKEWKNFFSQYSASQKGGGGSDRWRNFNNAMLQHLSLWFPPLFKDKTEPWQNGFTISSADLGRKLQERISALPIGICDFGEERAYTPIDLVKKYRRTDFAGAVAWLTEMTGIEVEEYEEDDDEEEEEELKTADDIDDETVIDPATGEKKKEEKNAKPKITDKKAKAKAKEINLYKRIGVAVLKSLDQRGIELLITEDQLWRCDDGIWSPLIGARDSLETEIEKTCELNDIGTEIKLVNEVRAWIMRQPQLHRDKVEWNAHGQIPTRNGLIDPKTLKLGLLTPEHYATWCIDIEHDPAAKCPWFERALQDMLADRPAKNRKKLIRLLQEILGVSLLDIKPKALSKVLIFVGDSNSGKTTAIEVMSGLLTDNPIATSLEMLSGPHGMMEFQRRAPWVVHEAFDGGKWHPSALIKSIITGDPVPINIKNGPLITMRITQPIYMGSNSPVQIREPTKAVRNRIIIIEARQVFSEDKLIGVAEEAARLGFEKPHQFILKQEKSGLLTWALAGMQRAMKRGSFEKIEEIEEALDEFRTESNIVASFLDECVAVEKSGDVGGYGPKYRIRVSDFCAAFTLHWEQNKASDTKFVHSNDQISRALKAYGDPRIAVSKELRDNGHRYYAGVHLNKVGLDYWDTMKSSNRFSDASKSARTSSDKDHVNQYIPATWDDKENIKRLRRADFTIKDQDEEVAPKKGKKTGKETRF